MIVKKLNKHLYNNYNEFLREHPSSMFYHSLNYKHLLEKMLRCKPEYFLLCDNKDHIFGILPLMTLDGIYGKVANSLPFFGSNGSILVKDPIYEEILLNEYYKFLKNEDIVSSTIISNPINRNICKFRYDFKGKRIGQWTNIKNINEKLLMERIDSSARRNIKKAIKKKIKIIIDNNSIDFIKKVHNDNMEVINGKPKEDIFFKLLPEQFQSGVDYNIYIASINQKPIAGLLLFYFKNTVEYFTPVIDKDFKSDQPLALIIFKAMLDASQKKAEWWNWGGTWLNQDGVYKFKSKWNAIDKPYYYFTICKKDKFEYFKQEQLLKSYKNFYTFPFG